MALLALVPAVAALGEPAVDRFSDLVRDDGPVAWWRFGVVEGNPDLRNHAAESKQDITGRPVGSIRFDVVGPIPRLGYNGFDADNHAISLPDRHGSIEIADPGDKSLFDFDNGDSITLEAWVRVKSLDKGQIAYIVGKGRSNKPDFSPDNQNWAMRLWGLDGQAKLTFVFHDRETGANSNEDWHRWTSTTGFAPSTGWHHVAVTYKFGEPESVRGYIDGRPVAGEWDMGGPTQDAPIVDNDSVYLATSMGGSPGSSFHGEIDEIAIYRHALSPERIARRFAHTPVEIDLPELKLVDGKVSVQIIESVPNRSWDLDAGLATVADTYTLDAFAMAQTPRKYNNKGLIIDRSPPYLVRSAAKVTLPAGEHELLVRSLNSSRLKIDGKVVAETPFMARGGGAHGKVPPMPEGTIEGTRVLAAGHSERRVKFVSDGQPHVFMLESLISQSGLRPEVGEISVSRIASDGSVVVLSPNDEVRVHLTDAEWERYEREQERYLRRLNAERRASASKAEDAYWTQRHELTREAIAAKPAIQVPNVSNKDAVNNDVDRFILARLEAEGIAPAELVNDYAFLRRVSLDTVGQLPSPEEVERFFNDPAEKRRSLVIERLLADDRWADHWTAYWQDALAENPGILKPMLNNTGPFRFFIYESFLDNKPIDRFATELMMMEGSTWYGGPAGFSVASQNDVPMAAKAHVVGRAFLGIEMQCARCHDAPFHDVSQQDLFELAAMLKRDSQKVPMSSSIPLDEKAIARMIVEVNLKPGSTVKPEWPFAKLSGAADAPDGILRRPADTRAIAAFKTTWHTNERFARVITNRVWARYLGFGIVSRPGDWQDLEPSHPLLLDYLSRELMLSGYDLKHVARLILNSQTYQRAMEPGKCEPASEHEHLFASPARRRMTAEQIVDSMYAAVGKRFDSEMLTMDRDARSGVTTMHNFGYPRRAWQFTSLSNERDRPSLAMPYTQSVLDVLITFGWRESRPNPIDCRDDTPTVQQPAVIANGVAAQRIVTLSDNSDLTGLAIDARSPADFIEGVYLRLMTRKPTADELALFTRLLNEGFNDRVLEAPKIARAPAPKRAHSVSWSNHLSSEANAIMIEVEQLAAQGDPPTQRLTPDWRQRAEDMVWAVLNSPEFVFVP